MDALRLPWGLTLTLDYRLQAQRFCWSRLLIAHGPELKGKVDQVTEGN